MATSPASSAQVERQETPSELPIVLFLGLEPAAFEAIELQLDAADSTLASDDKTAEQLSLSGRLATVVLGPDFDGSAFPLTLETLRTLDRERVGVVVAGLSGERRPNLDPRQIAHLERELPPARRLAEIIGRTISERFVPSNEDREILFRNEALAAHSGARDVYGDAILDDPGWARWTLSILVVGVVVALAALCLVRLPHYSEGPAIVQAAGRTEAAALESGVVGQLLVAEGESVRPGQLLVSLYGAVQEAEVRRLEEEFLVLLRKRMLDPHTSEYEVLRSRTSFEVQKERLARLEVRATAEGRVLSVLARSGEFIEAGRPVVLVDSGPSQLVVSALLPGKDRPALEPGQTLLLELDGYRDLALRVEIDEVASEALAADTAQRALGSTLRDVLHAAGPVVLVRGTLRQTSIESHGRSYPLRGGMPGVARVLTHDEPLVFELIPGLERLFQHQPESGEATDTELPSTELPAATQR